MAAAPSVPVFAGKAHKPQEPSEPPPALKKQKVAAAIDQGIRDMIGDSPGQLHETFLDCVSISWDDTCVCPKPEEQHLIGRLVGRYWKVGFDNEDRPVYRQESTSEGAANNGKL